MKTFNSFMAQRITEFIAYRESVGYSTKLLYANLRCFDGYLAKKQKEPVKLPPSFFLELRADLKREARSVNHVISATRMFFAFLVRCGDYADNPVKDIPFLQENKIIPFIFSEAQVDQLLSVICQTIRKQQRFFLRDISVYLTLLLIARCGLRISEPWRMLRHHYCPADQTLYIEKTKFKKDRLIPIPEKVNTELYNYLNFRRYVLMDHHNPYLLAGSESSGVNRFRVRLILGRAVDTLGINRSRRVIGRTNFSAPTVHSLRHSFAVNTLRKIRARNGSPQNALPILAAYMGHSEYKHTVKYLKMIDAGQRQRLLEFISRQTR